VGDRQIPAAILNQVEILDEKIPLTGGLSQQFLYFLQGQRIDLAASGVLWRFPTTATRMTQTYDLMFSHRHSWYAGSKVASFPPPVEDRACSTDGQILAL
jgi:hypothetical protein